MSFILDALKKSENDRQRQSGPALFEVRVPPPRSKFPLLAVSIVSLLVVNLGVVAWLMLREPADAAESESQAAAASQAPSGAASTSTAQTTSPPGVPPTAQTQPGYPPATGYTTVPANGPPPSYGTAPGAGPGGYAQQAPGGYPPPSAPPAGQGGYAPTAAPEPYLADEPPSAAGVNPDDYEPAQEPTPGQFSGGRASRGTESGLPTYQEAATRTTLPPLHLDLHSYAADPSKRFVLINMRRLYEGQTMPEGVKVENITPDSAIMSFNGTRFVLDRD